MVLAGPGGMGDAGEGGGGGAGLFDHVHEGLHCHRTTRQVSLTADGERLFHRCERMLAEFEARRADAAGTRSSPSGTLRVTMPICYGRRFVMPLLAVLLREHPQLTLELRLQDGVADLVRDGIDLAVRIGHLGDSTLVARRIGWQHRGWWPARGTWPNTSRRAAWRTWPGTRR